MRGLATDSSAPGGLWLADDLPEPEPAGNELVLPVRAFSSTPGMSPLSSSARTGWRPSQDTSGVVAREAADGSGRPAGTRVAAYPE
jgi:NADPH2:quinone reductase